MLLTWYCDVNIGWSVSGSACWWYVNLSLVEKEFFAGVEVSCYPFMNCKSVHVLRLSLSQGLKERFSSLVDKVNLFIKENKRHYVTIWPVCLINLCSLNQGFID